MGTLFGMVDMMMLGRSGDAVTTAASIVAVGVTNQLVFLGISFSTILKYWGYNYGSSLYRSKARG